jgi:nucleoid-associated protein YejK
MATEEGVQTLCGDRCLLKAVQRFSDSLALNPHFTQDTKGAHFCGKL